MISRGHYASTFERYTLVKPPSPLSPRLWGSPSGIVHTEDRRAYACTARHEQAYYPEKVTAVMRTFIEDNKQKLVLLQGKAPDCVILFISRFAIG